MNLKHMVAGNFKGILGVPDIHSDLISLKQAINFARENDLFVVFLGDLTDGTDRYAVCPTETVETVLEEMDAGRAFFNYGNHDEKFFRYAKGNNVTVRDYMRFTLDYAREGEAHLIELFKKLEAHERSAFFSHYGNWRFFHAGYHYHLHTRGLDVNMHGAIRSRLIYGDGKVDEKTGLIVREYGWTEDVPHSVKCVVGHDYNPMTLPIKGGQPYINTNAKGGKVFFIDTGCGKGGHLTTMTLLAHGDDLNFAGFKSFKR